jgi:hypothetical protein
MTRVLKITWIDTVSSGDDWVEDVELPTEIVSIGALYHEGEDHVTLILSQSKDGLIRGYISIPRVCVTSVEEFYSC